MIGNQSMGEMLRDARKELGISLCQLSEITGISKSTISDIENDVTKEPSFSTIYALARELDVSIHDLGEIAISLAK